MANTTNFGWETPDDTDLVKDGAAAIRTLAGAIDTSLVDLKGGTTGQVLAKNSNTDMDFVWSADASGIPATIFDAKGDLIVASAADTAARLAVGGTNGHVLTVNSGATNGIEWAAPAGGGKVLQVVMGTTTTSATNSTNTYADTNLTATITPSSTSSKVLVMAMNGSIQKGAGNATNDIYIRLMRGATQIGGVISGLYTNTAIINRQTSAIYNYLDSPATTSATTYKTQFMNSGNASYALCQANDEQSVIILMEIGA